MKKIRSRQKRQLRIRKRIIGSEKRPRLVVFRSNMYIYAQLVNDQGGKTLAAESDLKVTSKSTKLERAYLVGKNLAQKAQKLGIKEVVFDRGGFLYHGRVEKLAAGARKGGLKF